MTNEGLRVSYTGGSLSTETTNYLQIAQCWGTDSTGPARETCVFGGIATNGGLRAKTVPTSYVHANDRKYTSFKVGAYTALPFVAYNDQLITDPATVPDEYLVSNLTEVNGEVLTRAQAGLDAVDVNQNRYFTKFTTNEIPWAPFSGQGDGEVVFETQTALESSGLGCGSPVGLDTMTITGQSCWLVVIPRGTADNGARSTSYPGVWWDSWRHRIAFKLDFLPVGTRCDVSSGELQVQGSSLLAQAMFSWQGDYCQQDGGRAVAYARGTDQDAALTSATTAGAPLALVSQPLDVDGVDDSLVYAPVALTGVTISYSVDRLVNVTASEEEQRKSKTPFTSMKLNPRLLAKLLTDSYLESVVAAVDKRWLTEPGKGDYVTDPESGDPIPYLMNGKTEKLNPSNITRDPEFLQLNPDWNDNILIGVGIASSVTPIGRADAIRAVWDYILADDNARNWLAGEPDENGMVVNPYYATTDAANALGTALALPMDSFPKADPWELASTWDPATQTGNYALNQIEFRPYADSFEQSAQFVLRGDSRRLGGFDVNSTPPKWTRAEPSRVGYRTVTAVTDAAAAARFETFTALLENPAGEFVAATSESMLAAAAAMTGAEADAGVLQFDSSSTNAAGASTAYPLTVPVYAALNPAEPDADIRAAYADFVEYAATKGQSPGESPGELPDGYAPLPTSWIDQATAAASTARQGGAVAPQPTPSASPTPSSGAAATNLNPVSATSLPAVGEPAAGDRGATDPVADAASDPPSVATMGVTADDPAIELTAAAVPMGLVAGLVAACCVPIVSRVGRRT
ncbi:hypothetical protein [Diaminobutyricimonas sp. TR449]|uniref:hypothetical protein n=1 Tax=Diaminobutyricimonas sp. TR449 TaxID=2708076 RepID=UPI001422341D|nr:hypothetical protein [Diaminobutyricimonas sp. TR449]